jgi:hypothetical protein
VREEPYQAPSAKWFKSQRVSKTGYWSDVQLKVAMAVVEGGL